MKVVEIFRFNRYIVECKFFNLFNISQRIMDLIDT